MNHSIPLYIVIAFVVTYLIRVLPLTFIRKPITNVYIRSFLYYVPYATLAVMTFPAMMDATVSPLSGLIAFGVGVYLAWQNKGLPVVATVCCITVFVLELIIV